MLVDQQDTNVLSLASVALERLLDGRGLGFGIDDHEVSLRVWRVGDMLFHSN